MWMRWRKSAAPVNKKSWEKMSQHFFSAFFMRFLFGLAPLLLITAGNCSNGDFGAPLRSARNDRDVHRWYSSRQETVRVWFPVRHGIIVPHLNRKLFAHNFPFDMAPLYFIPTGNCSRIVSYSAWHHHVSSQQETFHPQFPVRPGTIALRLTLSSSFSFGCNTICRRTQG